MEAIHTSTSGLRFAHGQANDPAPHKAEARATDRTHQEAHQVRRQGRGDKEEAAEKRRQRRGNKEKSESVWF